MNSDISTVSSQVLCADFLQFLAAGVPGSDLTPASNPRKSTANLFVEFCGVGASAGKLLRGNLALGQNATAESQQENSP